jgi:hypothetical protein
LASVQDCLDTCCPVGGDQGEHQIRVLHEIRAAKDHWGQEFFGLHTHFMLPVLQLFSIVAQCAAPVCTLRHVATCAGGCHLTGPKDGVRGCTDATTTHFDTRTAVGKVYTGIGTEQIAYGIRNSDDAIEISSHHWSSDSDVDQMLRFLISHFIGGSMLKSLNEDTRASSVRLLVCLTSTYPSSCFHGAEALNKTQWMINPRYWAPRGGSSMQGFGGDMTDQFFHHVNLARFAEQEQEEQQRQQEEQQRQQEEQQRQQIELQGQQIEQQGQ